MINTNTVAELINALRLLPPNAPLVHLDSDNYGNEGVSVMHLLSGEVYITPLGGTVCEYSKEDITPIAYITQEFDDHTA